MKTPITYYGGKQTMLKHIMPLIPSHKIYTESFCGGAAVLFAKEPCDMEVINDLNMNLTTFYWMAKVNYPEIKAEVDKTLHSRDIHTHAAYILKYPQFFTQAQRAWAVWVLCKMSFAAKMDSSFGYNLRGSIPKMITKAKEDFTQELCNRLEKVTIENRDALKVIRTYDRVETFHFVDPPYVGSNCGHYEGYFNENDLEALLKLLENVQGKFMLTMFPLSLIEEYANKNGWIIHRIERTISAANKTRRKQEEWIICNYKV